MVPAREVAGPALALHRAWLPRRRAEWPTAAGATAHVRNAVRHGIINVVDRVLPSRAPKAFGAQRYNRPDCDATCHPCGSTTVARGPDPEVQFQ